jgi:hypothetical protein
MLGARTSSSALSAKREFGSMIFLETLRPLHTRLRTRTSALPASGALASTESTFRAMLLHVVLPIGCARLR